MNIAQVIKVDWNRKAELLCADVAILTSLHYDVGVSFSIIDYQVIVL